MSVTNAANNDNDPEMPPIHPTDGEQPSAAAADTIELTFRNNDTTSRASYFTDGTQTICCAGDKCMNLNSSIVGPSVETKQCSICSLLFHNNTICGDSAVAVSASNKHDLRYFPDDAQQMLTTSTASDDMVYFCCYCLEEVEGATTQHPFPEPHQFAVLAPNHLVILLPQGEVHEKTTLKDVFSKYLNEVEHTDISVSAAATNKVDNKKDSALTKLRGIHLNGHLLATIDIKLDDLRKLGAKFGIRGTRSMKKGPMADAIVAYLARRERQQLNGTLEETGSDGRPLRIDNIRLMNVLFGPVVLPLLKTRGQALTAAQLQDKERTDERFFRKVVTEYNDESNDAYNANAHGAGCGYKTPTSFQPIPVENWEKVQSKFKQVMKEYETCLNRCNQSGTHEHFEEVQFPDESTIANTSMLYLHHHMKEHPEVFNVCLSTLPNGVFRQSSSNPPVRRGGGGRGGGASGNTRRGSGGGGRGGRGGKGGGKKAADECLTSIKSKNDAQQENILIDTRSKLKTELRTEKQNKRELKEELDGRFNDSSGAIKRFKSGDEVDDDAAPFTDSQKELLGDYVDSEEEISLLKQAIADNQKKMSSGSNATA